MKIDEFIFAMSDYSNEYMQDPRTCTSHENDEGFCVLVEPIGSIRRVKSTPNLLQIPTPIRSRKKSDDSAVGSEECESELSSDNISAPEPPDMLYTSTTTSQSSSQRSSTGKITTKLEEEVVPLTRASILMTSDGRLLRPPSVVVSDHDIGENFITLDDLDAEYNQNLLQRRRLSDCSTCSTLSLNDTDFAINSIPEDETEEEEKKTSPWRRIRTIVHQLTPFIQTYKKQRYPWVQLAGHQGNFKAGEKPGTISKKFCTREKDAFELLMNDPLRNFVPKYYGIDAGQEYIQLEDLLGRFDNPCVMDCKIGVRTYLEEELMKAKEKPKLRKDMYDKMLQIDPSAPTQEEHALRGVTKPRYMVWRETISTTSTLGFRVEGIRKSDGSSSKDFKMTRLESEVKAAFRSFIDGYEHIIKQYLQRLHELRDALDRSNFFNSHEVIGSSLLFVHDVNQASVWMIDFAKTIPYPPPKEDSRDGVCATQGSQERTLRHDVPWSVGNHEDGYLVGLMHLIKIFEELLQ